MALSSLIARALGQRGATSDSHLEFTNRFLAPLLIQVRSAVNDLLFERNNVRRWGAVGDGIADDTVAIQNAINEVTAGGSIYFPPGTYLLSASLLLVNPRVRYYGAGRASILKSSTNTFHILRPRAAEIEFDNLAIEGAAFANVGTVNGAGQTGVYTGPDHAAPRCRFTRVWFSGPDATTGCCAGIKIDTQDDWVVTDCIFDRIIGNSGGAGCGYGVLMASTNRCFIHGNRFLGSTSTVVPQGRHAVYLSVSGDENVISNNIVKSFNSSCFPTNAGVVNAGGTNNVWRGNVMWSRGGDATDSAGIEITGKWANSVVDDNVSYNDGGCAIILDDLGTGGLNDAVVSNNRIYQPGTWGIRVFGGARAEVVGNFVIGASQTSPGSYAAIIVQSYDVTHPVDGARILRNTLTDKTPGAPSHRAGITLNGSVVALTNIEILGNRFAYGTTDVEVVGTVGFAGAPSTTVGGNQLIGGNFNDGTTVDGERFNYVSPIGATAKSGFVRLPKNFIGVAARNNAGNGDLALLQTNGNDVFVGDTSNTGLYLDSHDLIRSRINGAVVLTITGTEVDLFQTLSAVTILSTIGGNIMFRTLADAIMVGSSGSVPAAPSVNTYYLYVDTADNKLKAKASTGTVTTLASP